MDGPAARQPAAVARLRQPGGAGARPRARAPSSRSPASRTRRAPGHLALAALQAAAVPFFKVFLGAHLLLGLGIAFLLARGRLAPRARSSWRRPSRSPRAALVLGQGGETVAVTLAPLDLVRVTRETLGPRAARRRARSRLPPLALAAALPRPATRGAAARPAAPCAGPARRLRDSRRWRSPAGRSACCSASRRPRCSQDQRVVNDAAYLVEQSGPLLWLFAALGPGALRSVADKAPARRARPCCSWRRPPPGSTSRRRRRQRPTACRPPWCVRCGRSPPLRVRATSCCSGPAAATRPRRSCSPVDA